MQKQEEKSGECLSDHVPGLWRCGRSRDKSSQESNVLKGTKQDLSCWAGGLAAGLHMALLEDPHLL